MKKIIIICEGKTEQIFCKKILENYFKSIGIVIEYPIIGHSNGGIVKWIHLKPQIEDCLNVDLHCFVTTFIDFYGIHSHHEFPGWNLSISEPDLNNKMAILETGMDRDLSNIIRARFMPFIQLHEFEALVFSEYKFFEDYYEANEANFPALKLICDNYPNPELINDSPTTAPSKRLESNIRRYDKTSDGVNICEMIGLQKIRTKCPRFNNWITALENIKI